MQMLLAEIHAAERTGLSLATVVTCLIIFLHLAAMASCLRAGRVARIGAALSKAWNGPERRRYRRHTAYRVSIRLWCWIALGLVIVGLDKMFGVTTWAVGLVRQFVYGIGLEHDRRIVQVVFLTLIAMAAFILLEALRRRMGRFLIRHQLVVITAILFACFLVMKAISFHHLEVVLHQEVLGLRLRWVIEMAMLCILVIAAFRFTRWKSGGVTGPESHRQSEADPLERPGTAGICRL